MTTRSVIQNEYDRLGYRRGWTFMATPEERMTRSAIAFVGLNPGGGGDSDRHDYGFNWDIPVSNDHPTGNAYFDENWGPGETDSSVQKQVKAWHALLELGAADSFCAQFVPFRSPDWERLGNRSEAMTFGSHLWRWVLDRSPASLFVTMGKVAGTQLASLSGGRLVATLPTGWAPQTIDVYDAPSSGRRIVAMPHPSRYGLLGRGDASEQARESFRIAAGIRSAQL